jgi:hypothetical protein
MPNKATRHLQPRHKHDGAVPPTADRGVVTGMKAADILGAWGCSACHEACDTLSPLDYEKRRAALLEGVARTIYQLVKRGVVSW